MQVCASLGSPQYMNDMLSSEYNDPTISNYCGPFSFHNGLNSLFWDKISKTRDLFHRGEITRSTSIRPSIMRSWQRARAAGVPTVGVPMVLLNSQEFQIIIKKNDFFVNTAAQIMDELLENILPSESCIILTDTDGVYLHTIGAGEGFGRGTTCPLRGLISRETVDGTTAMGLCLEEKSAVCVLGCEHYNSHFDGWSCAAAPIFDKEGNMVGSLSLTLERDKFHQHTFGLVIAAAKAITEQMRLRRLLQEVQTMMELLGEAVLVFDASGTLRLINRYAKRLFHVHGDVIGQNFSAIATVTGDAHLLDFGKKVSDGECSMRLADGTPLHCLFSASPTPEGGLCVTLRESKRMHKLAGRLTGGKAVYDFSDIKGESAAMGQALRLARVASGNAMTTLILGESGVGKELFAQAIHNGSSRRSQPFIVVNCGAIPRDLVQSELFGYEAGAFTGANRQGAPGKFELADGGTIFLDEIGDMPLSAQISLLRVLQEGEVTRVGGKQPCRVDVRVVAATHRDLIAAVENGSFRHDLYYRLNVLLIAVPPLRRRRDDIAELAHFFLAKISKTLCKRLIGFTPAALECLQAYAWPGNVRELENLLERTAVVANGPSICVEDLPPECTCPIAAPKAPFVLALGSLEIGKREVGVHAAGTASPGRLIEALRAAKGNVRAAAKELGVSRVTLYTRIKRCGLDLDAIRRQPQAKAETHSGKE
uniref:Transcriptional regulator containing PAS, AAA-type ATPase, and DNA-binding domains n=1 Tax=Desulfovibrio sp. U5L TaxID=596152 RepID=I2Q2L2_9BACT